MYGAKEHNLINYNTLNAPFLGQGVEIIISINSLLFHPFLLLVTTPNLDFCLVLSLREHSNF